MLAADLARLHPEMRLAGGRDNSLLSVPQPLLEYTVSLMTNERARAPDLERKHYEHWLMALRAHSLVPMLYGLVATSPPGCSPPASIRSTMRNAYLREMANEARTSHQLAAIVDALGEAKVDVIVLKGPAFAATLYPQPATRPSADLDLLVRPEQFVRAREIFVELGYRSAWRRFEILQHVQNEESLVPVADPRLREVDLHWDLRFATGYRREGIVGELFERSAIVQASSMKFRALSPIDALVHASVHLIYQHLGSLKLLWIYDIARLAGELTEPEQWRVLQNRSSAWDARAAVQLSVELARMFLDLDPPAGWYDWCAHAPPSETERRAIGASFHRQGKPMYMLKLLLDSTYSPPEKLARLRRLVLPGPQYVRQVHPPRRKWLLPLSYVAYWRSWLSKAQRIKASRVD